VSQAPPTPLQQAKQNLADAGAKRSEEKAERWLSHADHLIAKAGKNVAQAKRIPEEIAAAALKEQQALAKLTKETAEHHQARQAHLDAQKVVNATAWATVM